MSVSDGVMELLAQPVYMVNVQLALFFPGWFIIALWSVSGAAISMYLYKRLSPQQQIADLGNDIKKLQQQLMSPHIAANELSAAMKNYLLLSSKKVMVVLWPSLVSSLPFLLVLPGLALSFSQVDVIHFGNAWMRHWISSACFFSLTTSLFLKHFFKIH